MKQNVLDTLIQGFDETAPVDTAIIQYLETNHELLPQEAGRPKWEEGKVDMEKVLRRLAGK